MTSIKHKVVRMVACCGAALLLAACHFSGITGSGNVTTEKRQLTGNFTAVEAGSGLDVVLEQSPVTEVTVIADDNVQEHIITKVQDGVLSISCEFNNYRNVKMKKVVVKMPTLDAIRVSSGANCKVRNTFRVPAVTVESSSGADIEISVEADKTICESSSGSEITISGKSTDLECASSSGSSINAEKLNASNVIASASSGSTTNVSPSEYLNASATSGGSVNFYKIPKNLNKKSGSGGSVNPR